MRFDFPAIMVMLVFVSGVIWAVDSLFFANRRQLNQDGSREIPKIVEYAKSFFPVFLAVLILRSFLVEPFRIPSGSMVPTLLVGDFILVNKYAYGIRLPVADTKIIEIGRPQRGDVMVFRYPEDPKTPFIKRVVGLPGDQVSYFNKTLFVNGEKAEQQVVGPYVGAGSGARMTGAQWRTERLDSSVHDLIVQPGTSSVEGEMLVPEGHYFVLGDNRDNSRDSRYWGTVPDELLIGRAFGIWMNWDWGHGINWSRIGKSIQ